MASFPQQQHLAASGKDAIRQMVASAKELQALATLLEQIDRAGNRLSELAPVAANGPSRYQLLEQLRSTAFTTMSRAQVVATAQSKLAQEVRFEEPKWMHEENQSTGKMNYGEAMVWVGKRAGTDNVEVAQK